MSVAGLLVRFSGLYIAVLIGIVVVFGVLSAKPNSGVNSGALVGSVLGACLWFANTNKRYLTSNERRSAFLGMWAIDMGLQTFMVLAAGSASSEMLLAGSMMLAMAFIGLIHGAIIYFMILSAGKQYAKRVAKGA